jgi:hypothetical protein
MLKLLKDSEGRNDVFLSFGPISLEIIESYVQQHRRTFSN